jgi:propionyl-CoA synthetase
MSLSTDVVHSWSTESGSPITALMINKTFAPLVSRPGSAGMPMAGMNVWIVDDEGKEVKQGDMGNLVMRKPLAPSALGGLWNNKEGFQKSYWDRYRGKGDWFDTGDAAVMDMDGYISILARSDDIIQVAGHRLGTGLIEQVVTGHEDVVECCVVGAPDKMKGSTPFALVVARQGAPKDTGAMLQSINKHVREEVGPIAQLSGIVRTDKLPKTRSGKTLRKTVRAIVENASEGKENKEEALPVPPTIEDKDVLYDNIAKIDAYFKGSQGAKAKL